MVVVVAWADCRAVLVPRIVLLGKVLRRSGAQGRVWNASVRAGGTPATGISALKPPNGVELSCSAARAEARPILAHFDGPGALTYPPASRVSFSDLLGSVKALNHPMRRFQAGVGRPIASFLH